MQAKLNGWHSNEVKKKKLNTHMQISDIGCNDLGNGWNQTITIAMSGSQAKYDMTLPFQIEVLQALFM